MTSIYTTTSPPPQYSAHYAPLTPPRTPPPSDYRNLSSNNPYRTSPRSDKMSFLGSLKGKLTKRGLNNPFSRDTSSDPPPAYSEHDWLTNDNDPYAFLSSFDTIFVVDDSGSMYGSNWKEVRQVLQNIVPTCTKRDQDGVDLFFLNHYSGAVAPEGNKARGGYYNITDPETVEEIFNSVRPTGRTPTGGRLREILRPYVAQLSSGFAEETVKPINVIVITDGCPSDDPESTICEYARLLDQLQRPLHQVGIQFFQVGDSQAAHKHLKALDDDLAKLGIRDMVDTCSWDSKLRRHREALTADQILKVVLGAVVRRIDRMPSKTTQR